MKTFLTRRSIALTIMLAVVALLARFAEHYWLLELLTHLTWHVFLVAIILTLLLLSLRKPGWALLAFGLTVNQFTLIDGYQGVNAETCIAGKGGEELTVLQFNISSRNETPGAVQDWLEMHRPLPDIILLFEATDRIAGYIKKMKATHWPYVLTAYRSDNYGIAVVSSIEKARLVLENIGDPHFPSLVIKGMTDVKEIPFTLVATHPPPPLTHALAGARNRQFIALARRLQQDESPNRILVGDLNVTPWSPWFRKLLVDAGLRNSQTGKRVAGTYPAYGLPSFLAIPIDHALVSPNIEVLERVVGPGSGLGSDHRPVGTRLRLRSCS